MSDPNYVRGDGGYTLTSAQLTKLQAMKAWLDSAINADPGAEGLAAQCYKVLLAFASGITVPVY